MLKIITHPDERLRQISKPIKAIDDSVKKLASDMLKTIKADSKEPDGVGLAAPQVGVLKRLVLMQMPDEKIQVLINPQIIKASKKFLSEINKNNQYLEGCLSIPSYFGFIDRPVKLKIRYTQVNGLQKTATLTPPYSSYFSHELDHLDGILFIDHINKSGGQLYQTDKKTNKLIPVKNPFS